MTRILITLVLSLVLGVTSVTLAVARGQAVGLSEMVICSGGTTVTVLIDAQGKPVDPPHHCPDCLTQAGASPWIADHVIATPVASRLSFVLPSAPDVAERPLPRLAARGPPVPV